MNMNADSIYELLLEYTGVADDPYWMHFPAVMKVNAIINRLTGAVEHCWKALASENAEDDKELVKALELFFDNYIGTINFPNVPDYLEQMVKSQIRFSIALMVAALAAEVRKDA